MRCQQGPATDRTTRPGNFRPGEKLNFEPGTRPGFEIHRKTWPGRENLKIQKFKKLLNNPEPGPKPGFAKSQPGNQPGKTRSFAEP